MNCTRRNDVNWTFRSATLDDWNEVAALLNDVHLPLDGAKEHLDDFLLAFCGGELAGVAGLERYDSTGLLRSVAVAERGTGLGEALVWQLVDHARAEKLTGIILLTTTAVDYFPRFGFRPISRLDASPSVQQSIEFKSACPSSAVVMELPLQA
jgi:N-acetylglutamate synthase-like GNAT family acetyltransferase